MKIKIIRFKSRLYLKILTFMGIIGLFSMSSCKGSEKTADGNTDVKPAKDSVTVNVPVKDSVVSPPVNKYGIPVNFDEVRDSIKIQPTKYGVQPVYEIEVKYGIPNNTY